MLQSKTAAGRKKNNTSPDTSNQTFLPWCLQFKQSRKMGILNKIQSPDCLWSLQEILENLQKFFTLLYWNGVKMRGCAFWNRPPGGPNGLLQGIIFGVCLLRSTWGCPTPQQSFSNCLVIKIGSSLEKYSARWHTGCKTGHRTLTETFKAAFLNLGNFYVWTSTPRVPRTAGLAGEF